MVHFLIEFDRSQKFYHFLRFFNFFQFYPQLRNYFILLWPNVSVEKRIDIACGFFNVRLGSQYVNYLQKIKQEKFNFALWLEIWLIKFIGFVFLLLNILQKCEVLISFVDELKIRKKQLKLFVPHILVHLVWILSFWVTIFQE